MRIVKDGDRGSSFVIRSGLWPVLLFILGFPGRPASGGHPGSGLTLPPQDPAPIHLSGWNAEGDPDSKWLISEDGRSVVQTENGRPTLFVSPKNFVNISIQGRFTVETSSDDDYIGFVFGYRIPDPAHPERRKFVLFDWKQYDQDVALEGMSLVRVDTARAERELDYWNHSPDPGFEVLAKNFGSGLGWRDKTVYTFTLLYRTDRITIDLAGGVFGGGKTIFDVRGEFEPGRFGFYNFSQPMVRYEGFSQDLEIAISTREGNRRRWSFLVERVR